MTHATFSDLGFGHYSQRGQISNSRERTGICGERAGIMPNSSCALLQFILLLASAAGALSATAFQTSPSVRCRTQHQRVTCCDGTHAQQEGSRLPERRVLPRRGAAALLPALGFLAGAAVRGAAAEDGAERQGLDKQGLKKDYDRYSASYEVAADP